LIFGNVDREDSIAVAADELGGFAEQQISIWTRHVEDETLRAILHKLAEKFQHRRGDGWIVCPNFNSSNEDGRVGWVDPVEEHHVGRLLVEAVSKSANVTGETNERVFNLFTGINAVEHHAADGVECI
jgi:hypothetical protein